jgi:transcription antitermination protein NusB
MARRREARRRAAVILFQADATDREPQDVLEERKGLGERIPRFTEELVLGVAERRGELDRILGEAAEGWTIDRMAAVDRTLLRVGCYELLFQDDVPDRVAVSEAVEAANRYSTEDSGRFVNGVLGRIARDRADAGSGG